MSRIVIVGAGLGGLTSAALLAQAGHDVTVLEQQSWVGGKSRRIEVSGQRIDTGPSLVTFPGVLTELYSRYDRLGKHSTRSRSAAEIMNLDLERLPEVGTYYFQDQVVNLPVEEDHPWFEAWHRFDQIHGGLSPEMVTLLTTDPLSLATLAPVATISKNYGTALSTSSYLDSLDWMPDGLKEVIAIHTLNAGIAPERTLALYATMPAVMAREGIFVPEGGVYEIALGLHRLATEAGATFYLNQEVVSISRTGVATADSFFPADKVIAATDTEVVNRLLGKKKKTPKRVSCSGVAIFAVLKKPLPANTVTHSVIMPSKPSQLHKSLDDKDFPEETMAFLNYYKPGHIYPNTKATAAILLTAPANGEHVTLESDFVQREIKRISRTIGLNYNIADDIEDYLILDPEYFAGFGATGGALYGQTRPLWQGGPFHLPAYSSVFRPWLWRVGASVHPGGGIPAVIGGAMNSVQRLLKKLT